DLLPRLVRFQHVSFFHDLVCIEPTWRKNDNLRLVLHNFIPTDSVGRLTGTAKPVNPSSIIDHLGNPVSANPRRLEPFHEEDPRPKSHHSRFPLHSAYSLQHLRS